MNKPFTMLVLVVAVLVAALLGMVTVLGSITSEQALDAGVKIGLILVIVLVAGLAIGMLSQPKDKK